MYLQCHSGILTLCRDWDRALVRMESVQAGSARRAGVGNQARIRDHGPAHEILCRGSHTAVDSYYGNEIVMTREYIAMVGVDSLSWLAVWDKLPGHNSKRV